MKYFFRVLYLFLLFPALLGLVDFFFWFYTDKALTQMMWDFEHTMPALVLGYAGGLLLVWTEHP